jgi:hypothetical protein
MLFTTGTTITFKKVLRKGTVSTFPTAANVYQLSVKNGSSDVLYNPSSITVVQSSATTDGHITVTGVPLTDGVNLLTLSLHSNSDADASTLTSTTVATGSIYKTVSTTTLEV